MRNRGDHNLHDTNSQAHEYVAKHGQSADRGNRWGEIPMYLPMIGVA